MGNVAAGGAGLQGRLAHGGASEPLPRVFDSEGRISVQLWKPLRAGAPAGGRSPELVSQDPGCPHIPASVSPAVQPSGSAAQSHHAQGTRCHGPKPEDAHWLGHRERRPLQLSP